MNPNSSPKPRLSACFIVRDEEKFIEAAIESIENLADEIVIVDSGSVDKTLHIVKTLQSRLGAEKIKVFERVWPHSFSEQKNYAIEMAAGDWILFLDADERIFSQDHEKIRNAIQNAETFAFNLEIRNYTRHFQQFGFRWNQDNDLAPGYYITHLHRLFRRDARIRYAGKLHERIEDSLQKNEFKTADLPAVIHHLGPLKEDDLALSEKRYKFYAELGEQKVNENPNDGQARWELGVVYQRLRRHEDALKKFDEAQRINPEENIFEIYKAMTLFHLQRWDDLRLGNWKTREAKFFKTIALAQANPEIVKEISSFEDLFVQAPLLEFELSLRHELDFNLPAIKEKVFIQFGKTGWPQALEAMYLRLAGDCEEAKKLAMDSWKNRCLLGLHELVLLESQSKNFPGVLELEKSLTASEKQALRPDTARVFEIARKLSKA